MLALSLLTQAQLNKALGAQESDLAATRNLALSGLEDFRHKLARDPDFPPSMGEESTTLGYSEDVLSPSGTLFGRYQIEYDLERRESHNLIVIRSTGLVGNSRTTLVGYLEDSDGLRWLAVKGQAD